MDADTHPCEHAGCTAVVPYDDEPYCFTHSPDDGAFVEGYSFKRSHRPPRKRPTVDVLVDIDSLIGRS